MIGAVEVPGIGEQWSSRLLPILREIINRKEPDVLGWRHDGTNLHLRFRTALTVPWVQVHVQSNGVGEGGFAGYDSANSVSSTETDCRAARVQDVILADLPYSRYHVFLVPVQYDAAGTKILYDGEGGRPDNMSFVDIGV